MGMDRLASAAEVDKLLGETSGLRAGRRSCSPQTANILGVGGTVIIEYPGWKTCRSFQFPLVQQFKIHFHKMD